MEYHYGLIRRRLVGLSDEDIKQLVSITAAHSGRIFYKIFPGANDPDPSKDVPIVKVEGKCQYGDCDQDATDIACGRKDWHSGIAGHPEPAVYCNKHARDVAFENSPEYIEDCPNCGCKFGIN